MARLIQTIEGVKCTAKVYWSAEWQEFRVKFIYPAPIGHIEEADYFTPYKDDAIATAKLEAGSIKND